MMGYLPELDTTHNKQVPNTQHLALLMDEEELGYSSADERLKRSCSKTLKDSHHCQGQEATSKEAPS